MTVLLGPTPCHGCHELVSVERVSADVECFDPKACHDDECTQHEPHTHAVRDVVVTEPSGERHACSAVEVAA